MIGRRQDGKRSDRVADFFEEHERLKQRLGKHASADTAGGSLDGTRSNARSSPLDLLISSLRALNYDVRPLEALRDYASRLDEEERKLLMEIAERKKTLEIVRSAREVLRKLGV